MLIINLSSRLSFAKTTKYMVAEHADLNLRKAAMDLEFRALDLWKDVDLGIREVEAGWVERIDPNALASRF